MKGILSALPSSLILAAMLPLLTMCGGGGEDDEMEMVDSIPPHKEIRVGRVAEFNMEEMKNERL